MIIDVMHFFIYPLSRCTSMLLSQLFMLVYELQHARVLLATGSIISSSGAMVFSVDRSKLGHGWIT